MAGLQRPLQGVRVLDFSTLLPGPLATLILCEAGAEVIKVERPGQGDEMRTYVPKFGADSVNFALLNRAKRSIAIDLKEPGAVERLRGLIEEADVIVEQFRPGAMERMGLGYGAVAAINPRVVYCSITGYGQDGPKAHVAGHDLNYVAESGMLGLAAGSDGAPVLPPALIADIAGGTYPAVVNILLALRQRDQTGQGCHLDVAMSDNLFTFLYWAMGNGWAAGQWPGSGTDLLTGGSARYQIYPTADGRHVACAALEDRFWHNFLEVIEAPSAWRDSPPMASALIADIRAIMRGATAAQWARRFKGRDVCCSVVATMEEALQDPHFRARGLFGSVLNADGAGTEATISALPVPVATQFRGEDSGSSYPALGEGNAEFGVAGLRP